MIPHSCLPTNLNLQFECKKLVSFGNHFQRFGQTFYFQFGCPKANFELNSPNVNLSFFNYDSLHARLNSHYEARSYKKKKHKKITAYNKSVQKEPTVKRCLLILDFKPLRSQVKGNHSKGREFQSLAVRGKKLLTQTFLQHLGMVTEKSCNVSE